MASYYVPLPAAQMPRNAMLDFSPVSNAIDGLVDQRNRNRQFAMQREQLDMQKDQQQYQRSRDQRTDARQDAVFSQQQKEWFGKSADAISRIQDPAARAQAWQNVVSKHPSAGQLPPEYMDPTRGPSMVAAEFAGLVRDPRDDKMKDLDLQYKQAQIGATNARAREQGASFGKTGQVFQDPQSGQFYSVQFGADGSRKIEPLTAGGQALTPSRGVQQVGDTIIDKATGGEVRNVGGALERGEFAKGRGRDNAEFVAKYPKVERSYQSFIQKSNAVTPILDRAIEAVGPNTTGWGAVLASLPATKARALQGDLNTIKANLAFGELQDMRANSPTGGALGAVTERELDLLSSTQAALDQVQAGVRVKENLQIIKKNWADVRNLRSEAYASDVGRFRSLSQQQTPDKSSRPPAESKRYRYNPETGELE